MRESSTESRTRDKNQAEKEALLRKTPRRPPFFGAAMSEQLVVIKTLWMTRCGCERIFLADGPGLPRLQGRGYRALRLVSRCRTVAMRLSGTSKRATAQRER
jgi:hypothetical protein